MLSFSFAQINDLFYIWNLGTKLFHGLRITHIYFCN